MRVLLEMRSDEAVEQAWGIPRQPVPERGFTPIGHDRAKDGERRFELEAAAQRVGEALLLALVRSGVPRIAAAILPARAGHGSRPRALMRGSEISSGPGPRVAQARGAALTVLEALGVLAAAVPTLAALVVHATRSKVQHRRGPPGPLPYP